MYTTGLHTNPLNREKSFYVRGTRTGLKLQRDGKSNTSKSDRHVYDRQNYLTINVIARPVNTDISSVVAVNRIRNFYLLFDNDLVFLVFNTHDWISVEVSYSSSDSRWFPRSYRSTVAVRGS